MAFVCSECKHNKRKTLRHKCKCGECNYPGCRCECQLLKDLSDKKFAAILMKHGKLRKHQVKDKCKNMLFGLLDKITDRDMLDEIVDASLLCVKKKAAKTTNEKKAKMETMKPEMDVDQMINEIRKMSDANKTAKKPRVHNVAKGKKETDDV